MLLRRSRSTDAGASGVVKEVDCMLALLSDQRLPDSGRGDMGANGVARPYSGDKGSRGDVSERKAGGVTTLLKSCDSPLSETMLEVEVETGDSMVNADVSRLLELIELRSWVLATVASVDLSRFFSAGGREGVGLAPLPLRVLTLRRPTPEVMVIVRRLVSLGPSTDRD